MIDGCLSAGTWAGREIAENVFATSDCVWRESGNLIDINDQPVATCSEILAVGSVKVKEWRSLFLFAIARIVVLLRWSFVHRIQRAGVHCHSV